MNTAPGNKERPNTSAGHLSVSIDDAHVEDFRFSFDRNPKRTGASVGASFVLQAAFVVAIFFISRHLPAATPTSLVEEQPNKNIIWLAEPGPGGGGGGGGNRMKEPPKKAEEIGKDKITVPVQKPPKLEPVVAKNEPNPLEQLNIPAKELSAADIAAPGAIEGPPGPSVSQGSGSGGGAGTGNGTGIGPGEGSGLGPGRGGGTGGGVYQPGNGVSTPVLVKEVKPAYTSDAMRAKVQGEVWLQCVVNTDGTIGEIKVVRSLDSTFGLDLEAIKAARQWRFRPGTRKGEAVPVQIVIALTFTLR